MAKKDESKAIDKAPQAGAVVERNPADASTYRILNRTEEELNRTMEVFHHNLRGQKLTELNLPRAKVPPQGMTIWSLPGAEGDIHIEDITGILVEYTTPRAYWDKPLEPGAVTPPNCSSPDGIRGTGDPGGPCHLCPFSKYGSNPREGSNGQACSEKRMLLLLRPDSILPLVVQAPSTSIRNVFDYTMNLANDQELAFHHVYTQLTLEKVGGGGLEYSKVNLKSLGPVAEEYIPRIEAYQASFIKMLGTQQIEVVADTENIIDADAGSMDPNAGDPNAGDPNAGDPNAGDPNAGDPNGGDPNGRPQRWGNRRGERTGLGPRGTYPGSRERARGTERRLPLPGQGKPRNRSSRWNPANF